MTHLLHRFMQTLYLKGYNKRKNQVVEENHISITELELVSSLLIQRHSSYNMENANVCYAKREPSHALH